MERVLETLSPQKLFRRSMLVDHDIRFPEEKVRLEDGMMLTRAYYAATRVSTLGDYDYYFIRARDDGQNISQGRLDPPGYTWSIGEVSRLVKEHDPDPARADRIVLDLYRRKCLKMYGPVRFGKMQNIHRDQWLHEHAKHIATYIPPELEAELSPPFRQRSERVRAGDKEGLLLLGRIEQGEGRHDVGARTVVPPVASAGFPGRAAAAGERPGRPLPAAPGPRFGRVHRGPPHVWPSCG